MLGIRRLAVDAVPGQMLVGSGVFFDHRKLCADLSFWGWVGLRA